MRHTRSRVYARTLAYTLERVCRTLKGVCQNLGFTNLYQPAYELTEVLRAGTLEGSGEWFARVTEQYKITTDAIRGVQ